jgi:urease accessory protein
MKSEVYIHTALRVGCSYLKDAYFTQPFKIADITENRKDPQLHLMLMSSSPGVLDGDEYRFRIEVAANCSLCLETQSYQRLFTMKGSASQEMDIHLLQGASFRYLPHPVVPHLGSDFTSETRINLAGGNTLVWGEVVTCGRKLNGEVFAFRKYHSITEVFLRGKLIIKENLLLQPSAFCLSGMGQMEGFTHQASLVFLSENSAVQLLVNELHDWLCAQSGIVFGISAPRHDGFVLRLLGQKAEQLFECLKIAAGMCGGR